MFDAIVVGRRLVNDFPPHAFVLRIASAVFEVLDSLIQCVDHILRSSLGGVAILPGILECLPLPLRGKQGVEGLRCCWRRDGSRHRYRSVQGEEGGQLEICHIVTLITTAQSQDLQELITFRIQALQAWHAG